MALPPYTNMSTIPTRFMPQTFLWCLSLRTGCLILGYLNLVNAVIQSYVAITFVVFVGVLTNGLHLSPLTDDADMSISLGIFLLISITLFNSAWFVMTVACVIGVHKRKAGFIKALTIFVTFRLVSTIINAAVTSGLEREVVFIRCFDVAISACFLLVYYWYIAELKRENANGAVILHAPSYLEHIPPITLSTTAKITTIA